MIWAGEVGPDTGDAQIAGYSIVTQLGRARQLLGYCPQVPGPPFLSQLGRAGPA